MIYVVNWLFFLPASFFPRTMWLKNLVPSLSFITYSAPNSLCLSLSCTKWDHQVYYRFSWKLQSPLPRRAGCPADLPRPVLTAILGLFPSPGSCVEALVSWSLQLLSRFTFGVGRVPCMLTPPARGHWGGPRRRAGDWDGLSGFLSCPVGSCLAFKKSSEFQFLPAVLVAISSACARPQVEKFVLSVGRFLPFAVQITWLRCS